MSFSKWSLAIPTATSIFQPSNWSQTVTLVAHYVKSYVLLWQTEALCGYKTPRGEEGTDAVIGGRSAAGWNPCDPAGHVPSTATEKWEQTASSQAAPAPLQRPKDPLTEGHNV